MQAIERTGDHCRLALRVSVTLISLSVCASAQAVRPAPMFAQDLIAIGDIQGTVEKDDIGHEFESPRAGDNVVIQGIIHETILQLNSHGETLYGFFIQNAIGTEDGDPSTSDGLFVHMGKQSSIRRAYHQKERYHPAVGDEIVLSGQIRDLFFQTRLTSPVLHQIVQQHVNLDTELPAFETRPPDDMDEAYRYWETHEGMRATIPTGSLVQQGLKLRKKFAETETVLIHPEHPVAQREEPHHRRVFRDFHPLDDQPDHLFDNQNGYRIHIANLGIKGIETNVHALLNTSQTFDVLTSPLVGAVYQFMDSYYVQPVTQPKVRHTVDLTTLSRPPKTILESSLLIATLNLDNLFDHRDDPDDPCDAPTDPGNNLVDPPFDYLPANQKAYHSKLRTLAAQILDGMQTPHLILVQEAEDQDMASFSDGEKQNIPDGKPDVLQELARAIQELGGPVYDVATDRDGADYRGIVSGFIYQSSRVELVDAEPDHFLLGQHPNLGYEGSESIHNRDVENPKCFNTQFPDNLSYDDTVRGTNVFSRAVQIGLFRIWKGTGKDRRESHDLYALCNHFSSRPNKRIGQRREQSRYNALAVTRILDNDPTAWVVVGGDLNTFPRPDEPNHDQPTDPLGHLYEAGLHNMHDRWIKNNPASAYTYVYKGQAGTLDHLFLSDALNNLAYTTWIAHVNADWPRSQSGSDHDPAMVAMTWPSVPIRKKP